MRLVGSGGRAVERNLTLPIVPTATMIGVKPLFSGRSLGEGESAGFDVIVAIAPDGKPACRQGLRYELLKVERRYPVLPPRRPLGYEPVKGTRRIADGRIDGGRKPGRIALPVTWGRYRLDVASDDRSIPPTSVTFDAGFYSDASPTPPDLLESRSTRRTCAAATPCRSP